MSILIAESGSTKTDWRLINELGEATAINTQGINPYYLSKAQIQSILAEELLPQLGTNVKQIYFYGAGCSGPERIGMVMEALSQIVPGSSIHVHNDLLAASRSLCGNQAGIACILGTGSNACRYDGHIVVQQLPNLGFWLGDEGSGAHLGKQLIRDFFHQEMPGEIYQAFDKKYGLRRDYVLERMYTKPFPNRYAASFCKFLQDNIGHPYAYNLVYQSFIEFFTRYVLKFDQLNNLPIRFCGSIAWYFADTLRNAAADKGLKIADIVKAPIDGLVAYHKARETSVQPTE